MARSHTRPVDAGVRGWLAENAGGWSVGDVGPQHPERHDFSALNLGAVRDAVLARLDVTGAELRSAFALERRKARRLGDCVVVGLSPETLAHLGIAPGDSIECTHMPDGSVVHRRAPEVDVKAVRARVRAAGVSPRLLARLFYVPETTVRRIVKGAS